MYLAIFYHQYTTYIRIKKKKHKVTYVIQHQKGAQKIMTVFIYLLQVLPGSGCGFYTFTEESDVQGCNLWWYSKFQEFSFFFTFFW